MLPRLWPRLLRRVKQRCRARRVHVGTAIEPLETLLLLSNWSSDVFDTVPGTPLWTNNEVQQIVGNRMNSIRRKNLNRVQRMLSRSWRS